MNVVIVIILETAGAVCIGAAQDMLDNDEGRRTSLPMPGSCARCRTQTCAPGVGTDKAHAGAMVVSTRGRGGSPGAKFGGQRALGRG